MTKIYQTIDGNEAAADIGYRMSEVCAIYPITPASNMGEYADQWSGEAKENAFGTIPHVVEMQSEASAAGALHGAIQTGSLGSTFTASQGLLLMIPNMYKIAGELTPTVIHVSSRSVATQAMSIYCDHSDVMSTRGTGFGIMASANSQEAQDLGFIAHAASLKSRVPFLHFFDGFRTSHEITKIEHLSNEQIQQMVDPDDIIAQRNRRLSSENPFTRGAVENQDIFFQARESVSPAYVEAVKAVADLMEKFEKVTGRHYEPAEYFGHPDAEQVVVLMTSGTGTVRETVEHLQAQGEKVGVIQIRLFRPFPVEHFMKVLPKTCKTLCVLDRTKEPGSTGEPLYQEVSMPVILAHQNGQLKSLPKLIGGRYAISGKEFTPGMVKAIFDELKKDKPKNHFTIGINDDLSHTSLTYEDNYNIESDEVIRAMFYGLGADGTVSANKNTIKIIGEGTDYHVQGYFVYDSKKSGSKTVSHLRFGPKEIRSAYLINEANFIGCHQFTFIHSVDVLKHAANNSTFLLNSIYGPDEIWDQLPKTLQETIINKNIDFYIIDAYKVAKETGMGARINTIMQACFFALSKVLPKDEAIKKIKESIEKTYARKGQAVIEQNFKAVDAALENMHKVKVPDRVTSKKEIIQKISDKAPQIVKDLIAPIMFDKGDDLPVSMIPDDGTFPCETTRWEKRSIALNVPEWDKEKCIQCGRCSFVCPHSVIRVKECDEDTLKGAPETLQHIPSKRKDANGKEYVLQVYADDCMECHLCVEACPVKEKALKMVPKEPILEQERKNIEFFETLPYVKREDAPANSVKDMQFIQPLFEFCGACTGCGEAPYVRLMTQLFGDRSLIATACGCALVYGSMMPAIPWVKNEEGNGPAYSGSLFEDNAEFGFGYRLSEDKLAQYAAELLQCLADKVGNDFVQEILTAKQETAKEIAEQRRRVTELKKRLSEISDPKAKQLLPIAEFFTRHSIWALGGDGWAYDIGYGGLDHVIASNRNINILVLDTEVYSNTGGQSSKATPLGAVAKFATLGKRTEKKDLGLMAMTYGSVYVASIAMGANQQQAIKALQEADAYDGPALIIAYSPCIAHGYDMKRALDQQSLAVQSGYWPLYRYNPARAKEGLNPMQLDSKKATIPLSEYRKNENRFTILNRFEPEAAERLLKEAQADVDRHWKLLEEIANRDF